jgi:hypothetical protein
VPRKEVRAAFVDTPLVSYYASRRVRVMDGVSLGDVYDPYFNRSFARFCSHKHTPNELKPSGFACGVMKGNVAYLAHPVFSHYNDFGVVAHREFVLKTLRLLLGEGSLEVRGLPSTGRATLMEQPAQKRYVAHLLFANAITRGAWGGGPGSGQVEVIEDLVPLRDVEVVARVPRKVKSVRLVPEGKPLAFTAKNGAVSFTVPCLLCHQMVEMAY